MLAEEALKSSDLRGLANWVDTQPAWSDLPFIILTHHGAEPGFHQEMERISEVLGNVTLIERPFHPATFVSVARAAFKGRLRQYDARALIQRLRDSEEGLERRVAERTAELNRAHALIVTEIEQREEAENRLRQSQKMEMIGQLTGGVAHDFNNLLMAVISNLELLAKRAKSDATALRLIDGAMQGAHRGASLTQRLLAFARRQDLSIEPVDLTSLVIGVKDLIERAIGRQIELKIDFNPDTPPVLVDANQVELAILNLIVNARDAMPNGGIVTIKIDQPSFGLPENLPEGEFVRLTIADTGIGMDAVTLSKATEPFFSTKEIGKGTGLGLSMVHGLARQLGGALRLLSVLRQGTTAEFWMPATTLPVTARDQSVAVAQAKTDHPKYTILVVDDDALIAMSTAMMVEDLGHTPVETNSAADALDVLRSSQQIDVMVTDFSMPKMNGAQLALAAKQIRPTLPIIIASGFAELPAGLDTKIARLGKPYHQEQLEATIDAVTKAV